MEAIHLQGVELEVGVALREVGLAFRKVGVACRGVDREEREVEVQQARTTLHMD